MKRPTVVGKNDVTMPTVDEATTFARELIELEYVAEISSNSETDDAYGPKLI